ncbi:4-hydroxy-tetrahydrodipicolinate reductase [Aerococcus sp. UMB7834]|uniref:4-hydroxy-tetrahydrodipicolinate reductase n=1 Tax=Aerococcus sp. UMB7834 TaxID=3046342 RepID=UPI002550D588|nr:4-hydroxy-tetrahydrodipicolinate reductase [Aerococcus sp. UMB7834]MDK6804611.1 4-hydroxy-tetrahydrodipicolinate reductase [Aerococcus sp. UMB7834]
MKVLVTGFLGRMGQTSAHMVVDHEGFDLAALVDIRADQAEDLSAWQDLAPVYSSIEEALDKEAIDVAIDFCQPDAAYYNTRYYIEHGVHPVVGTTGFSADQIEELKELSQEAKLGGMIAPNFAISSVLMQVFAQQAAKYLPDVEIIEMHHNQKLDAPSGTAQKTAELIYEERGDYASGHPDEKEQMAGARGADFHGIRIHSVRLPGLNSHQVVQFGGTGEALTIRQDSFTRESYMKGVAMAVDHVMASQELIYGLENIL